ncbi:MAG: hypothetical protein SWN10_24875, partial [Pseudomonadota bacterium]|nr:hypothetical protein [Pseudomonadota bacterium]
MEDYDDYYPTGTFLPECHRTSRLLAFLLSLARLSDSVLTETPGLSFLSPKLTVEGRRLAVKTGSEELFFGPQVHVLEFAAFPCSNPQPQRVQLDKAFR